MSLVRIPTLRRSTNHVGSLLHLRNRHILPSIPAAISLNPSPLPLAATTRSSFERFSTKQTRIIFFHPLLSSRQSSDGALRNSNLVEHVRSVVKLRLSFTNKVRLRLFATPWACQQKGREINAALRFRVYTSLFNIFHFFPFFFFPARRLSSLPSPLQSPSDASRRRFGSKHNRFLGPFPPYTPIPSLGDPLLGEFPLSLSPRRCETRACFHD